MRALLDVNVLIALLDADHAHHLRARDWLVANMGIAPSRIQTKGLGDTKLIVTCDKSQEEQAPNRRVEIVLKTNHRR